ncbi:MAG: prepilin-type N-terminal cleavage/methylation domain-containing protein [Sedimentisphaerales bacterium]|nr:prepilin-type N-terminal cleavage/methylation domain-containing protein [Sedimentisphaerales bacterium]
MTCSARMQAKNVVRDTYCVMRTNNETHATTHDARRNTRDAFTLTELLVVLVIISLFVMLIQVHLFGLLRKNTFKAQTQELVSTIQMAARAAAETGERYEITIDIIQQSYELKHILGSEIYVDRPEETPGEVIVQNNLTNNCRLVYVWFDDGIDTNTKAWFRVGPAGWQNGGKIVLHDEKEQPYSIVVNALNRIVTLEEGDIQLLEPKLKNELRF